MSDPYSFTSTTPRLKLPNLFAGQAQKEFTVNEGFARLDSLLHAVVEGEANTPPATPAPGDCWLVGTAPTGDWNGQSGAIACRQAGSWLFTQPILGMSLFDKTADRLARYDGTWQRAAAVAAPTGGPNADAEARAAITGLIDALKSAGILASP